MEETRDNPATVSTETDATSDKKIKTRTGSGYLRQMYSTARSTATANPSHFKSLTTFLVNFVPTEKVDASELQVRTHFDQNEIDALAKSVKEHGVLQPILVVQNGDRYKVIAGERRLRASKQAGLDRIPARVINSDDKAVHEIALRENLDRVDLHPLEEGEGYVSLLEAQAFTSHEGIAAAFGKQKSRITECISYTRLPTSTKQELLRHNIKQRAVFRKLLGTPPEKHAEVISAFVAAGEEVELQLPLSVASVGASVENSEAPPVAKAKEVKSFEYKLDEKSVAVPGFRWKVGEGSDRLKDYIDKMMLLLSDAEKFLKKD